MPESHPLIRQLSKLRESSKEAIANANSPIDDELKNYLHITRPVEVALIEMIKRSSQAGGGTLLMVCGNVGDGKSHLLARLKGTADLESYFSAFLVHNDATESYSPNETCNDTLEKVLQPFNDSNWQKNQQKIILAINLGTLSNFLIEKQSSFSVLKAFVEKNKIVEAEEGNDTANEPFNPTFQFVNFTNYHFYSLSGSGPRVDLIEQLLERIVSPSVENPIYKSYQWTKEQPWAALCPVLANFEFLSQPQARKVIANLLVACLVKEKQILSFRQILNFIYDLIVPYPVAQTDLTKYRTLVAQLSTEDRIQYRTAYYLFENPKLSKIFHNLHQLDPAMRRYEELDERCVLLFTESNALSWLSEEFKNVFFTSIPQKPEEKVRHEVIMKAFLRFKYFKSPEAEIYKDDYFLEYISALHAFNNKDALGLRNVVDLVKKAAYSWNGGTLEKNKAIVHGTVKNLNYRVFKQLKLKTLLPPRDEKLNLDVIHEFSPEISLNFSLSGHQVFPIVIDYSLYVLLQRVSRGYRPNKLDRYTYVNFARFVEHITFADIQGQTLFIDEINFGFPIDYQFEFNDEYQEFTFFKVNKA